MVAFDDDVLIRGRIYLYVYYSTSIIYRMEHLIYNSNYQVKEHQN